MPLRMYPSEEEFKDHNYRGDRRAFCDGCGTGVSYKPQDFVFPPEQVDAWIKEHEDHDAPKGKRK